ncbi:efflux RND transporter periplasmic adaptor subunit [Thalassotalea fusca]
MNTLKNARLLRWGIVACVCIFNISTIQSASAGIVNANNQDTHVSQNNQDTHDSHHKKQDTHVSHEDKKRDTHDSHRTTINSNNQDTHVSHEGKNQDTHANEVSLTPEQIEFANIIVSPAKSSIFEQRVYAPGEVKANGYTSYVVSPRIESVVVSRHATLGQHVQFGDPLVTLFSEAMAEAQASYRVAYNDWQRSKRLAQGTVSESQLLSDETKYIAALSKLKAFGLTEQAIANVVKDNSSGLGEYTLVAQRAGAVLQDEFSQGQRVSAGQTIMLLADESELWVEAKVSTSKPLDVPVGSVAIISVDNESYEGLVIQEAHTIDPVTRTRTIRLAVKNAHDKLHPGMFVDVYFSITAKSPIVALPEQAMMRSADGDWTVYVEDETNTFKAVEVSRGRRFGELIEVTGVQPGQHIVMYGAFYVASELAKGGFDPHNH